MLKVLYYYEFDKRFHLHVNTTPTLEALLRSIMLGIFIPLVSSVLPIKEALGKNINDALDYSRSKTKAVLLQIIDPNTQNISTYLIFGALSTGYAIAIYILLPQSLLSLNLGLILQIFFMILIGLLFG